MPRSYSGTIVTPKWSPESSRRRSGGPAPLGIIQLERFLVLFGEGASDHPSRSGFADRLEDRGGQRVGGRLAGPHDVLKGRIEAFAFADRDLDQVVQLLGLEAFGAAQRDGVPEHRQAFLGPEVEVAEPHLLVDQSQQAVNVGMTLARDAYVIGAG